MDSHFYGQVSGLRSYNFPRWTIGGLNNNFDFMALEKSLDCTRLFNQCGVIFNDGDRSYLIRPSRRYSNSIHSQVTHIIISKINGRDISSSEKSVKKAINSPSLGTEIASTALSCGGALLTLGVFIFGIGATPITAGASTPFAILGYAGAAATTAQCINGVVRLYDIEFNDSKITNWFDSEAWYISTCTILDVISLAAAGGALAEVISTYKQMKSISSLKAIDWLKSWPRQDRARLTEIIIKTQNPGISNKEIKALIRAGVYPSRYPVESVQRELKKQLVSALSSASAFMGSAVSGVIKSPDSIPKVGDYVIGMIQSFAAEK